MVKLTETTNDKLNGGGMPPGWTTLNAFRLPEQNVNEVPVAAAKQRRVAIIGTAPSSRQLAPYKDPTWEIWACSAGNMNAIPRVDCWFEIHSNLLWPEHESWGRPYVDWLNAQSFPVYMQDNSLVPRAQPFPVAELVKEFGRYFFTSSFAWMMAMAIKEGAAEIGLWGIDMASRDEYILQRAGGQYFIQEAKRRGIKVTIPKESDLLQPPGLYGFDDGTPFGRKMAVREKELKDRIASIKGQIAQLEKTCTYLEGAAEDIDYMRSIWSGVQSHVID